ncbi:CYTH and CHAD domain-containing protein [uncultured Sneathiella sp.]|uniref:CYTH and CHAD domain-containing protein n=1 Tax=uncultured Sneathiella sp. TaxID=879315 RepID=UPI0025994C1B|nr:CYTH and CHAD domain-containing protein [uncultured Sneathiella sp.]
MSAQEIELKLTLSESDTRALATSPGFAELAGDGAVTRLLRSVYFDTPDAALGRERISLRIRDNGEARVQTVKLDGGLDKGLSQTLEYENEIAAEVPDLRLITDDKVRERIEKALAGQVPVPLFETRIERTAALIDIAGEGTIELAIDRGNVRAGDKSAPLNEVELELKSGAPFAMLSAAEKLFTDVAVTPSKLHKARRGFALIGLAEAPPPPVPALSEKTKITRKMTGVTALRSVGNAAADQILQNWEFVLADSEPAGPHMLRVGLRRLRTALHMLNANKLGPEFVAFEELAQRFGATVGELRDADVLLSDIFLPAARRLADTPKCVALHDALIAHNAGKRKAVRDSLQSADWTRLKLYCLFFDLLVDRALAPSGAEFRDPGVLEHADKALAKCWRRVSRWGKRIDTLTEEERHSMRKSLKSLRYVTEFFLPLYSAKKAKPFLKKLERLQDVFGYLNDVTMSRELLAIVRHQRAAGPDLTLEASAICHWHLGRADMAWQDARKYWKKLSKTDRFWE